MDDDSDNTPQDINIKVNSHLNINYECILISIINFQMVHIHKNYTSRKKYNDIALLELTENVKYDNAVLPGI